MLGRQGADSCADNRESHANIIQPLRSTSTTNIFFDQDLKNRFDWVLDLGRTSANVVSSHSIFNHKLPSRLLFLGDHQIGACSDAPPSHSKSSNATEAVSVNLPTASQNPSLAIGYLANVSFKRTSGDLKYFVMSGSQLLF